MIASIRVVSIEEAKTAIKMLQAYLAAHGEEVEAETPAPKAVTKAKTAPKAKEVSEPVAEKKTVKKAPVAKNPKKEEQEEVVEEAALTLASITAKAKEVRASTSTAQVKEVIAKYTTGKLSTIKEDDYEAFIDDLYALVV